MTLDGIFAAAVADSQTPDAYTVGTPAYLKLQADIAAITAILKPGIAAADLAVQRGDLTTAAGILAAVNAAEYQAEARAALADILNIGFPP